MSSDMIESATSRSITTPVLHSPNDPVQQTGSSSSTREGSYYRVYDGVTRTTLPTNMPAVIQEATRSIELRRQIERLHTGLAYSNAQKGYEGGSLEDTSADIASAVALLTSFMTGPLDIPVASVDEDGNPSLFIKSDTIYADVTFEKKSTEYYLKIIHGGELQEIFDKELVDGRYIPPRLFGRLLGSVINK